MFDDVVKFRTCCITITTAKWMVCMYMVYHFSTGKKIETDTTLELKLHIVLDKSSGITTFSSPLHKRMKPSDSPVHDCISKMDGLHVHGLSLSDDDNN
jgi:hypothetical protein